MAETTWAALRGLLADRYDDVKSRLARQVGSEDLASESLHETWLHLDRHGNAGPVRHPLAYLLRIAFNIARDRMRAEKRRAGGSHIAAVLEIADPAPDPARQTEARLELRAVERAIQQLPERCRTVLIASRLGGQTHQAIAERLGISRRTVLYELKYAVRHLDALLDDSDQQDCASEAPESSQD